MYPTSSLALAVILALTLGLFGCGGDSKKDLPPNNALTFAHDGLTDYSVNDLYQFNQLIFATTDKGLFVKKVTEPNAWKSAGLSAADILDLVIFTEDHYLATVAQRVNDAPAYRLMETIDAGVNWYEVAHNFGGDAEEAIAALHYDQNNHRLFAQGVAVLAVSYDEGRSWQKLT